MTRKKLIPLLAGGFGAGLLALEVADLDGGGINWFWAAVAGLAVVLGAMGLFGDSAE